MDDLLTLTADSRVCLLSEILMSQTAWRVVVQCVEVYDLHVNGFSVLSVISNYYSFRMQKLLCGTGR